MAASINVAIYARYSSSRQREESIEGQLRECQEYATRNGMTVVATYIDRAMSAKTDQRPEFQRMIKDSGSGVFSVILVWKLDRFARDRYDSAYYKNQLKRNGVQLVSAKESISSGPEGIILESMLEGMAEYYSAELSQKIRRGQYENAQKCRSNGSWLPLGYRLDDERCYQIDPLTEPVVLEIFTRYADGETVTEITDSLNTRGIQTSHGGPFNKNSLRNMLSNRLFIGEYRYRDTVVENGVPALISPEVFGRVQQRIHKNRTSPACAKAKEAFLLTTKLFCGLCGEAMVGESGTSKTGKIHYYYKCVGAKRKKNCPKKAVQKAWIEQFVVAQTVAFVLRREVIERIADAIILLLSQESNLLPTLRKQLRESEKSIQNLLLAIESGVLTPSTKARMAELEACKESLEISIAQESIRRPILTREQIIFWLERFKKGDIHDPLYQRSIIDYLVNAVYLYDGKIVLTYNYKDGTQTISLDDIQSSDLFGVAPPQGYYTNTYYFNGGFAVTVWL